MTEQTPQSMPSEAVLQAGSPAMGESPVVVPPEQPKKGHGLLWLVVVLAVVISGGSLYFFYMQSQKPAKEVSVTPPRLGSQQGKPNQGFVSSTPAPTAMPTLTSSDGVADIEKDLTSTTIESGNASEFDADLQSL